MSGKLHWVERSKYLPVDKQEEDKHGGKGSPRHGCVPVRTLVTAAGLFPAGLPLEAGRASGLLLPLWGPAGTTASRKVPVTPLNYPAFLQSGCGFLQGVGSNHHVVYRIIWW